ncbi:carotenoid isomerooxygenase-like [Homalodisca vitripennis]|uniref:carotenoid isomerooxygenase-like n=1 Tax=Homalodisca vitripennis TaxID=197043 RepID=UPI001EEC4F6D|nr:carotenoid isomerooxygenase-like [Homalodisca vitripennis]
MKRCRIKNDKLRCDYLLAKGRGNVEAVNAVRQILDTSGAAGLAELRRRQEAGEPLGRGNVEAVNAVRQIVDTSGAAGLAELRRRQEAGGPLGRSNVEAVNAVRQILDTSGAAGLAELRRRQETGEPLYPNYDTSTYMRNCEKEILEPIHGKTTGTIPSWLRGTLLRNGPGRLKFGDSTYQHFFDGSALLHRFAIHNGEITYQTRFLDTCAYRKNRAANRIVVGEFGTRAIPDPCQSIFSRLSTLFSLQEPTDNANVSVYPFKDQLYCFTETTKIHRIDPTNLDTLDLVDVSKHVAVVNHTAHPHVTQDGTVYNQAMSIQSSRPHYSIVRFPTQGEGQTGEKSNSMFENAEIVTSIKARWPFAPSYMHSFGLTENYFIIIEQPFAISFPDIVKGKLSSQPMSACLRFFKDEDTLIHVVERATGQLFKTYSADAFLFFHTVNQFECDNQLVVDICCYKDSTVVDNLYFRSLLEENKDLDYIQAILSRPLRFVLPLAPTAVGTTTNLVTLEGSEAVARWRGTDIRVQPESFCDLGCEMPRFNYDYLGRPYRYFYAVSTDVELDNPGTLIKVDTQTKEHRTWSEPGVFPSEPIFVSSPDPKHEDDGVILSTLLWGRGTETQVGLLVLEAKTLQEIGRTVFQTQSAVPRTLHGWFTSDL